MLKAALKLLVSKNRKIDKKSPQTDGIINHST
jgi:hypothetical protein